MRKILISTLLIIILYSCDEKVYFDIPLNEKPIFSNNDTICFRKNNSTLIDTFLVRITDEYEVSDKKYYHEFLTIKYIIINRPLNNIEFYIDHNVSTSISVFEYYFPTIYKNESTTSINMNGKTYLSVYEKSNLNFPDTLPSRLYYSHSEGIIKYAYSDTLFYEIIDN